MAKLQLATFLLISIGLTLGDDSWKHQLLDMENGHRADHQAAPFQYNDELAQKAQNWANQLAAECGKMHHEDTATSPNAQYHTGEPLGENIHFAGMVGGSPTNMKAWGEGQATGAAEDWYKEIQYYPWPEFTGSSDHMVFHFTQMVWQGTREVGYGLGARDGCPNIYVVARYYPEGNVLPMFGQNVLPA
ncbi:Pathogenesis-related protein 1C [Orchesella cincta]|uniref:Pathogenesis-related protein 1C n=1 Tax=Orchesella cincta TaxID=48709 RepID=A0A1D2MCJ1_ORCCI|nr:Pathogenesis-related protein 1C [Orchesella cincta]